MNNDTKRYPIHITDLLPTDKGDGSYLPQETRAMEIEQHEVVQEVLRRLAKVNAREHHENKEQTSPEGQQQLNMKSQHPNLDSQRFDGTDPNLNPEPPLNTDARREFDNKRREQEKEKQLRLGNMPKFSTAPKPRGPA